MNKTLFALTVFSLCCSACIEENVADTHVSNTDTSKLVGNPLADKEEGVLLVRFTDAAVNAMNEGAFDAEKVTEGISEATLTPVFSGISNETAIRHGLHKWYELSFDDSISPETAAELVAGHDEVEAGQYNSILKPVHSEVSAEYVDSPVTRAAAAAASSAARRSSTEAPRISI